MSFCVREKTCGSAYGTTLSIARNSSTPKKLHVVEQSVALVPDYQFVRTSQTSGEFSHLINGVSHSSYIVPTPGTTEKHLLAELSSDQHSFSGELSQR